MINIGHYRLVDDSGDVMVKITHPNDNEAFKASLNHALHSSHWGSVIIEEFVDGKWIKSARIESRVNKDSDSGNNII